MMYHPNKFSFIITLVVCLAGCQSGTPTVPASSVPTDAPTPTAAARITAPPPTPTPLPATPTLTPSLSVPTASPTPTCTTNAAFIADVTVPDGSVLAPNTPFVKTWRIRNAGTCDWGSGLTLAFAGGAQLGGSAVVAFPPTDAGTTRDISLNLKAPATAGTYEGKWYLRGPEGERLTAVTVSVVVPATPTPTPPPSVTPKPTPVPTYAGTLASFLGEWRVVEDKFGDNVTDTQRLFRIGIAQADSNLVVSPDTWPLSPYAFAKTHQISVLYQGGHEFEIEFDDPTRGHIRLHFRINKACNATVNLAYPGFQGKFIVWNVKPQISCT